MNTPPLKRTIATAVLALPLMAMSTTNAAIIYSEDFTGQNGKGAIGPGPTIDTTGVTWSIDVSAASLTATSDWFQVRGAENFSSRDLDGVSFWNSPTIPTTPGDTLDFSLFTAGAAATEFEEADTFIIRYFVDGAPVALTDLIPAGDTFNDGTVTQGGIVAGSNFQLQVEMLSNAGGETLTFDDIVVNATPVPEPSSAALIGLAGLMMFRRRR